jgi:hypothetical protein
MCVRLQIYTLRCVGRLIGQQVPALDRKGSQDTAPILGVNTKDGRDSTNKRWSIWDREGGTGLLITHARTQVDGVGIVGDVELGWMRKLHGVIENERRVVRGQEEVIDEWFSAQDDAAGDAGSQCKGTLEVEVQCV